MLENADFAKLR